MLALGRGCQFSAEPLEAAARTLPVVTLFFVPIALAGLPALYPWARPEVVAADPVLQAKRAYLNVPFFLARAVLYFAGWNAIVWLLARWSREQDVGGPQPLGAERKFRLLSAPGLLAYGLFVTFASIDWVMSLDPHWYSTIFGVIFMGGQGLAAMALAILLLAWLQAHEPYRSTVTPAHFHDLGTLLFAFVMLWAYFAFSQFLIIWSGNLPEEITWYLDRMRGGWGAVAVALAVGQFVVPFLLLLSRDVKRSPRALAAIAAAVLAMRYVDLLWMIVPTGGERFHWLDLIVPAALLAFWSAALAAQLRRTMPLPVNDPYYAEYMSDVGAH